MQLIVKSTTIAAITFACSLLGVYVHLKSSADILSSHDLIISVCGFIGTLFAIVLGLLISSSYTTFNSHQTDLNTLVSSIANINSLLKPYAPSSNNARQILKNHALQIRDRYWPEKGGPLRHAIDYQHLTSDIQAISSIIALFKKIEHHNNEDLHSIRQSSRSLIEIQYNIVHSLSNTVPTLLLKVIFGWVCILFFLFGILSGANIYSIFFLLLGTIAIASTNFLILELADPYQGVFRVSSSPLDMLLLALETSDTNTVKDEPALTGHQT